MSALSGDDKLGASAARRWSERAGLITLMVVVAVVASVLMGVALDLVARLF